MTRNILIATGVAAVVSAGLAWATPGMGGTTTLLQRATTGARIKVHTKPREMSDLVVQHFALAPGGFSGWHAHPGPKLGAVKARVVAYYSLKRKRHTTREAGSSSHRRAPECTVQYFGAGEAFFVAANEPHFIRNEGSVVYEDYSTFVLPAGAIGRIEEAAPGGNCPS